MDTACVRFETLERIFLSTLGPASRKTKSPAASMHVQRADGAARNGASRVLRPEAGILAR